MSTERAKQVLSRLAGEESTEAPDPAHDVGTAYGRVVEEATAALDDLDAAAAFVEDDGLQRLEAAVERAQTDLSGRAGSGRETLAAYRAYRAAAAGPDSSNPGDGSESGPR